MPSHAGAAPSGGAVRRRGPASSAVRAVAAPASWCGPFTGECGSHPMLARAVPPARRCRCHQLPRRERGVADWHHRRPSLPPSAGASCQGVLPSLTHARIPLSLIPTSPHLVLRHSAAVDDNALPEERTIQRQRLVLAPLAAHMHPCNAGRQRRRSATTQWTAGDERCDACERLQSDCRAINERLSSDC